LGVLSTFELFFLIALGVKAGEGGSISLKHSAA